MAIGDPVEILPPHEHERISALMQALNFSRTVWGLEPPPAGESLMPEAMARYSRALGAHVADQPFDPDDA